MADASVQGAKSDAGNEEIVVALPPPGRRGSGAQFAAPASSTAVSAEAYAPTEPAEPAGDADDGDDAGGDTLTGEAGSKLLRKRLRRIVEYALAPGTRVEEAAVDEALAHVRERVAGIVDVTGPLLNPDHAAGKETPSNRIVLLRYVTLALDANCMPYAPADGRVAPGTLRLPRTAFDTFARTHMSAEYGVTNWRREALALIQKVAEDSVEAAARAARVVSDGSGGPGVLRGVDMAAGVAHHRARRYKAPETQGA
jgi:hypothetical protein